MEGPGVEQRLAAILAADVAGYTRLMAGDEPATISTITEYRDIFRSHIEANGGRVVDMAGDSILAVFNSAAGAVKGAVEAQGEVAERNTSLPEARRMRFRIGINLGDIREADDGTIYGDGVIVAARLEGLAEPGGVMISDFAYQQVRRDPDVTFHDAGTFEVKNLSEAVRAYRLATSVEERPLTTPMPIEKSSIAVLPFDNMSRDQEQEYFSDGITEDIITALSRIRWLTVIARNSSFTYKGKAVDVKQVGREMGVRYVLEGSVRRTGNRVRITAQLIEAETGTHIWAERYDRDLGDIFAVQDEITETIATAIEPEIGAAEMERARRKPPGDLSAWDAYQRGLWHSYRYTAADNATAKDFLERAIAIDPDFGPSHAALAYNHFCDVIYGYSADRKVSIAAGLATAKTAVALDERDPFAHSNLGRLYTMMGEHALAEDALRRALALSPSFALAHFSMGLVLQQAGRSEEALPELELAMRLSPHDPQSGCSS